MRKRRAKFGKKLARQRAKSWRWACHNDNGASDWQDSVRCTAESRGTFKTPEAAAKAAARHNCQVENRFGHNTVPHIYPSK